MLDPSTTATELADPPGMPAAATQQGTGLSANLAKWAAETPRTWTTITLARATQAFEDTYAAAATGAADAGTARIQDAVAAMGRGHAGVFGRAARVGMPGAALANGYAGHALELDDNFHPGLGHAGTVLFPALWAIADGGDFTVFDVLDAFIVGTEILSRVGLSVGRGHTDLGWHGTSTVGTLGAAIACARLLKLNATQMCHALSIATSMASGTKAQFGTDAKPLQAGIAARNGVEAAFLARHGIAGNVEGYESKCGFLALYTDAKQNDLARFTPPADGESLAIERWGFAFKRYPCCGSSHRAADALLELMENHRFTADDVESIHAKVGRGNVLNLRFPCPTTAAESRFSMQHAIAVILRKGHMDLADFTDAAANDPENRRLGAKVRMTSSEAESKDNPVDPDKRVPHQVIVTLRNGTQLENTVLHAKGSGRNPINLAERQEKFRMCCSGLLDADQIKVAWNMIHADATRVRSRDVTGLLCPSEP